MSKRLAALVCAQLTILLAQTPATAQPVDASHHELSRLEPQKVKLKVRAAVAGDEQVVSVSLKNKGRKPALAVELTLVDGNGDRVSPALYSDNYVTVLPGEPRTIEIRYPARLGNATFVAARGWNVEAVFARAAVPGYTYLPPYYQQPVIAPAKTAVSATSTVTPRH